MPTFLYKAKDQKGSLVEGQMDADGRAAVVSRLQQMGYFPVAINAGVGGGAARKSKAVAMPSPKTKTVKKPAPKAKKGAKERPVRPVAKPKGEGFRFRRGITASDIASFNRQLADLISSGVPLVKGLSVLSKQTSNEEMLAIITEISSDVQGGSTFADALSRHPKIFSKLYVAMVRSGEAGGMLDEVLQRLAEFSEDEENLKSKVKSSLAYPVVMIIAGSGAIFIMFAYVIPKIVGTFEQLNQALPAITQMLITTSNYFSQYWYFVLGGFVVAVIAFYRFVKTAEGKAMWDRVSLRIPVLGNIIQKREVARFARTLGSLLKNGVSILTALEIVREVVNNTVVKQEVDYVVEEITQGSGVAQPLRESTVFPPVAVNMIAIGEETGRLPDVLLRVSQSFETEVDRLLKTLTSLIEPLIIVIMGLVVGFIVIAMLLPIFSLDPTGGNI